MSKKKKKKKKKHVILLFLYEIVTVQEHVHWLSSLPLSVFHCDSVKV